MHRKLNSKLTTPSRSNPCGAGVRRACSNDFCIFHVVGPDSDGDVETQKHTRVAQGTASPRHRSQCERAIYNQECNAIIFAGLRERGREVDGARPKENRSRATLQANAGKQQEEERKQDTTNGPMDDSHSAREGMKSKMSMHLYRTGNGARSQ